jgi:hypothetical protein
MTYQYTIEDMKDLAKKKEGKCLSTIYEGSYGKLKWKCRQGHEWLAIPNSVRCGKWCKICGFKKCIDNRVGKNARGKIDNMKLFATKRGGKCLSKEYSNNRTNLQWQCKKGHKWFARPDNITINNRWCPFCSESKGENICRRILEEIYGKKFIKRRHSWLLSPKGSPLELDGYNKKLKIAFEYQGEQHYSLDGRIKNQEDLYYLQICDTIKREQCLNKGIHLIEIPYTVKYENIMIFILNQLPKEDKYV